MEFYHVDVFSSEKLLGNGLTVIFYEEEIKDEKMLKIAQEFKQFETIFLKRICENKFRARIFTVEEELDFAGHPILGAAATIHEKLFKDEEGKIIIFELNKKVVTTKSIKRDGCYEAEMNQGKPEFIGEISNKEYIEALEALNLTEENLYKDLPLEIISTGLAYLLVPLASGIEKAKIIRKDFQDILEKMGAKFVYLFDIVNMEGRTWDNQGLVEDVATGSAAGPMGAYLYKNKIVKSKEAIIINQGRFVNRPSEIRVSMKEGTNEIIVAGEVSIVAKGEFL